MKKVVKAVGLGAMLLLSPIAVGVATTMCKALTVTGCGFLANEPELPDCMK